ncbi:protein RBL-like isoform X2 [Phragmites australis]|uniref:protein RBL-like isoform X2 n=1 Tax=Phragmites australis TaxID=29695 RepID=UPI002D77610D|nr:protein RBL-like isoform X2 [Phragmites australis]
MIRANLWGIWLDPYQGEFPETIEEYLHHGSMKCISFNRTGTLLAAGCSNGSCVIWDFETRGLAREFRDKDCTAPITSVSWSKYGHRLLASATDKSLTLWDVSTGDKIARITLQQTPLHACLHPGSPTPSICLACPLSSAPLLVDLNTGSTTVLPVSVSENGNPPAPNPRNKFADGTPPFTPTAATFDKHGDLIYVGNSKGEILIIDSKSIEVHAVIFIPGGTVVKDIVFSRDGQYLLTNSNDRVIRVYKNLLPVKGSGEEIGNISNNNNDYERHYDKLKAIGASCLVLSCELSDAITKIQWKAPCFSGNGEWIVGASANKGEHRLQIWDQAGRLVKILEGPKEALIDLAWHPVEPTIATVSVAGLAYIWAKEHVENWSAFAPDFVELEENEEYVEREDEFDLNGYEEQAEEVVIDENADIDVETCKKNAMFSDVEDSVDEIVFLPAVPSPDDPDEQLDKCLGSSSKLEDSNHSGSPSSMDAAQIGQVIPPASSPMEVDNSTAEDPADGTNSKRKRRLSAKGLELQQAEKGKKPTKNKANGKSTNSNGKQMEFANGNSSAVDDEATEDDEVNIDNQCF